MTRRRCHMTGRAGHTEGEGRKNRSGARLGAAAAVAAGGGMRPRRARSEAAKGVDMLR